MTNSSYLENRSNYIQNLLCSCLCAIWLRPSKLRFFYKRHFYKQRQAGIGKGNGRMLSNTLGLSFHCLEIIHIFRSRYHPGIVAPAVAHGIFGAGFSFHVR